MNKIFLTQDGEVLRVQKRGQILLTLNAKENGNAAVAKRWEDVEDLRVTANIPNVSGIVRLPHTFDGSDMTIAAHYEWHDCNVMVIGNLGGVPFEFNIELKVDAAAAETTSAIVEVPALDAGGAGGSAGGGMVEVTHAQLKAMRDAGQLVAGQQYRITDYVATTTDPESRSANHPFDIIVTADNERTLSESARAIAHAGDTYFEKCNLAAWRLQYCIDNDAERFAWADDENGKGVVFRMIDENNNDIPYDFKGIQFKRYEITSVTMDDFSPLEGCFSVIVEGHATSESIVLSDEPRFAYLFDVMLDDLDVDDSVGFYLGTPHDCKMEECESEETHAKVLPNGVSIQTQQGGQSTHSWKCGSDSIGWTCGDQCSGWTCGSFCSYWTCGRACSNWKCDDLNIGWICSAGCNYWTSVATCIRWSCPVGCSYFHILSSVFNVHLNITPYSLEQAITQFVSKNSNGELKVWNPADLVQ